MVTELLFSTLCAAVAVQRLSELSVSGRNEAHLRARGAREYAAGHFPLLGVLHCAWLGSALCEVWVLDRPFLPLLTLGAGLCFLIGQLLRSSARRALGERWSVRIVTLRGTMPVASGPYRRLRHPNYLGVALEIAALPLLHGAWLTALFFTLANALLMTVRIRAEEQALAASSDYAERFARTPRFWPRLKSEES